MKKCSKCNLELPSDHKGKYCVGPRHACWCRDSLNQWRISKGIITKEGIEKAFYKSLIGPIVIKNDA